MNDVQYYGTSTEQGSTLKEDGEDVKRMLPTPWFPVTGFAGRAVHGGDYRSSTISGVFEREQHGQA